MNQMLAIARKELRSTFLSPVALIFLCGFLGSALIVFFLGYKFFLKNVADVRPFFLWMPYLLVVLVSAYTMRLWSEESRSDTIEVLLTLPIKLSQVVLGKFLAGLALVALALLLTLPVPISVSFLGDLDWGPVIGGYLGLLLLAGVYLAVGMFVSSFTDNQIVALMFTVLACGLLALIGSPWIIDSFGAGAAGGELLRSLGVVGRFESILRGVIDLRDLVYYLSLIAFFLVLNVLVIERRRWGRSLQGRPRRRNAVLAVGLLGLNLVVFNLGLGPVMGLRADLTAWNEYSISKVTRELIRGAREPLLIRGYLSDNTHPLLKPLVPRITDFLKELDAVGGASVSAEVVDPTKSEEAEKEAHGVYGIRNLPVKFEDRHQASVVNAYFSILVRYGDQFQVLDLGDLIAIDEHMGAEGVRISVRLLNLEYNIAKAIKKVVYGFQSIESICSRLSEPALLEVLVTPRSLPQEYQELPERIEKVAAEFRDRSSGRFDFRLVDPDDPQSGVTRESLYRDLRIKPVPVSLFSPESFYLHMVMRIGAQLEPIVPEGSMTEAEIRRGIMAALQRHTPGALRTVGLAVGGKPPAPVYPGAPPPQGKMYRSLERMLGDTYEVQRVDLSSGRVAGEVDVLLVVNPVDFGERERYALDQFLMRGGAAVVAAGKFTFEPSPRGELEIRKQSTGLEEVLQAYGVELGDGVVLDEENLPFPVPVTRNLGGIQIREIRLVEYPPFVRVSGEGLDKRNPAARGLPAVIMQWASPVRCREADGLPGCQALLTSSDQAWTQAALSSGPEFEKPQSRQAHTLAVTVQGVLPSAFAGKDAPILSESEGAAPPEEGREQTGRRGTVIERSADGARLVVLGSSSFVEDVVLSIAGQASGSQVANLQFVHNLVDWSVEDPALLQIRSREQFARTLDPVSAGARWWWELGNYLFALFSVVGIGAVTWVRRRRVTPILPGNDGERRAKS